MTPVRVFACRPRGLLTLTVRALGDPAFAHPRTWARPSRMLLHARPAVHAGGWSNLSSIVVFEGFPSASGPCAPACPVTSLSPVQARHRHDYDRGSLPAVEYRKTVADLAGFAFDPRRVETWVH